MSHPFELTLSWFLGFIKEPQAEHTRIVQYSTIPDSGISMYFFILGFILEVDCQLVVMKKKIQIIFHGNSEFFKEMQDCVSATHGSIAKLTLRPGSPCMGIIYHMPEACMPVQSGLWLPAASGGFQGAQGGGLSLGLWESQSLSVLHFERKGCQLQYLSREKPQPVAHTPLNKLPTEQQWRKN